jgi:hypothetical protein
VPEPAIKKNTQDTAGDQGATEKIKRENDAHLRQLAKKNTYVFFFF